MAHECVDWTASPPARKIPLLILTRGDDRVYTVVPNDLKTLENLARREFDLGDADIVFSSSCLNLCNGLPARISESAWEHISPYIGCVTVEVSGPRAEPPYGASREEQPTASASKNTEDERDSSAKRKLRSNADEGDESEQPDHGLDDKPNTSAEAVRDEQSAPSDHGNDYDGASAAEDQPGEPREEVSTLPRRKPRTRRRMTSEDEDEGEESERGRQVPASSRVPPISSPPKPSQPSQEVKERDRFQSGGPLHQSSKPIKQEKHRSGSGSRSESRLFPQDSSQPSHADSQNATRTQARVESSESDKLMIRVAHRPSKQESKFTTKSTTKVAKVLAGACKSLGLDVGRATLYLIISTEDEEGDVENLFPCDKNDTIARAGAEHNAESRFLLKIAGEA